jgi:hypothetical protein
VRSEAFHRQNVRFLAGGAIVPAPLSGIFCKRELHAHLFPSPYRRWTVARSVEDCFGNHDGSEKGKRMDMT